MQLTDKEKSLLKDLCDEEKLCIEKYERYSKEACADELKQLFSSIADTERTHHQTLSQMMQGSVQDTVGTIPPPNRLSCAAVGYTDEQCKNKDALMCKDMLSTEKHASSMYDTSVFEFVDPNARKMLNHIQAEEQQHGQQLFSYMSNNNMM